MTIVKDFKGGDGLFVGSHKVGDKLHHTKSYGLWHDIRKRCAAGGSVQAREPSYLGCTLSDNFKDFQYFANWHTNQIGYGIDGYHIDKDILVPGNKTYSEDTCVLVPQSLNNFLTSRAASRGRWPQGVTWKERNGRFRAQISIDGKSSHIGLYTSLDDALRAYKKAKNAEAYRWYERLKAGEFVVDTRVIERMRTWKYEMDEGYFNIAKERINAAQDAKAADKVA